MFQILEMSSSKSGRALVSRTPSKPIFHKLKIDSVPIKLPWAYPFSFPGVSRRWPRILRDPANWGASPRQLPGCPRELGGPAEPISFSALQHCGPALHHPASGPSRPPEKHTGHGSQPVGLWHWPRESNTLPAVSGAQERNDGCLLCSIQISI